MSLQSAKGETGNVYLWLEGQSANEKTKSSQWKNVIGSSSGLSQSDNIIISLIY
jgi:hypothetical protein